MQSDLKTHTEGALPQEGSLDEARVLVARLRERSGDHIDDFAVLAIAEATGAPVDYVRLAATSHLDHRKRGLGSKLLQGFRCLDEDVRRAALSGVLGSAAGWASAYGRAYQDPGNLSAMLLAVLILGALLNAAVSRNARAAAIAGAVFPITGALVCSLMLTLFALFGVRGAAPDVLFTVLFTLLGAWVGALAFAYLQRNRDRLGLKDPAKERRALLLQLHDIQERLRSEEKPATFLSLDIVGSSKLKGGADPLAIEYTFAEFHLFVESVVQRSGGRIHSTSGDGVLAAFELPEQGYRAGKAVLAGLFEFNAYRNKTGKPLEVRAGLHTGTVLAPGKDIVKVDYAQTIDLAAHLQKAADPGTMAVSQVCLSMLGDLRSEFTDQWLEVDGVKALVWKPKTFADLAPPKRIEG